MAPISASHIRVADFDQCVEHGLKVKCRAADDLEHIGDRRLLLQRFAQLIEQAGVLDRNHGLRRKAGDQLDLLVGEGTYLLAVDGEDADEFLLLEHRNVENGPEASQFDRGYKDRFTLNVSGLHCDIGDMSRLPCMHDAAEGSSRTWPIWSALPELGKCWRHAEHRGSAGSAILKAE